jgi:hypothetical protein
VSERERLAKETREWYERAINVDALPATEETELLLMVPKLCDALEEAERERERLRAIADAAYDYLVWRGVEDHPQKQGRLEARRSELKAAVDRMWGHWGDYRDARGILAQDSEAEE